MNLIKDERTGRTYRTPFSIEKDCLCGLHTFVFIKAGVLTEEEAHRAIKCVDKWPFIKVAGTIDGRTKAAKNLNWFTWRIIFEK